jgi:crotonobetainyl-CoA:carnitine CoA-transferase CaiB-like acyl-CoA transferase
MAGPLEGMRVIDWTLWQQGPVAGAMLGDLGAEVIKIEDKDGGDFGRAMFAINGMSTADQPNAYFEVNNRNKKSVAIDLRTPQGREIVQKLIATADIFIHNFRPGVPERFGLDYETLKALNPQLIYASASAFGAKGPDAGARAYDTLGSARSGISMAMAQPGTDVPISPPGAMADQMGAIMLAYGVLAAVAARYRHGVGQQVETSLLGSMMWLQGLQFAMQLVMGFNLSGRARPANVVNPLFTHYRCADGKWIALAMLQSDKFWTGFAEAMQAPALLDEDLFPDHLARLRNGNACHAILEPAFASRDRAYWLEHLAARDDFPICAVNTFEDVLADPQTEANQYVIPFDHPERGPGKIPGFPVQLSATPAQVRLRAPELGEHTEEVLISALGMTWEDFEPLRANGVI